VEREPGETARVRPRPGYLISNTFPEPSALTLKNGRGHARNPIFSHAVREGASWSVTRPARRARIVGQIRN
jgi:hypothetical protein